LLLPLLLLPLRLYKADFKRYRLCISTLYIRSVLKLKRLRRRRLDGWQRLKGRLIGGPIWVDFGDATLDRDCHAEALGLKGRAVVKVLFLCAPEALAA
jgi:hypothetical protein